MTDTTNAADEEPEIVDVEELIDGVPRPKQADAPKEKRAKNGGSSSIPSFDELQRMPPHPMAAMFPMLPPDELADLAEDIRVNGVNHPIMVSHDGQIIDGRNRLAACAMVGVTPPVRYFEGDDPAAFIISENVNRRHLSKSQAAMASAMAFPDANHKGGRGHKAFGDQTVSRPTLSQARTVVRLAPDLAESVLAGAMTVDAAYKQACIRKSDSESRKGRLNKLAKSNPDLAEAVANGVMTLDEAENKIREAKEELRVSQWAATRNICDAVMLLDRPPDTADHEVELFDPQVAAHYGHKITPERLERAAAFLAALTEAFRHQQGQ